MALSRFLVHLLIVFCCAIALSCARTATYIRHNVSKGRNARLISRGSYGGDSGSSYGGSNDYGSDKYTYNGGSTHSTYVPQQIPTQGGFVAGRGAYYGAHAPYVKYRHSHITIPLPEIEIPKLHFPILGPRGPPPLFLPHIDIPHIHPPHFDVPRIPHIHPPLVNFPALPPVKGIDIPIPSVRFVKEKWHGGGGSGGGLYKRTGRELKAADVEVPSSRSGPVRVAESREVPIEAVQTRQIEINFHNKANEQPKSA